MSYYGTTVVPPETSGLWAATVARLASSTMNTILGGSGRVKMVTDSMAPEGAESEAWGRLVIAPVQRFFGEAAEEADRGRLVPWLIRAEVHSPGGNFNPLLTLQAAHREAYRLLHGWHPGALTRARVQGLAYRELPPQPFPSWDETNGLYWMSAEYRIYLLPALPA